MSSSSSPTRTSRTNPNGARAAKQNERHAQPPAQSPENASRQPRTARPAAKRQRSHSDPHRAGRSFAGNVSSNANSRVLAVSESNSSSRLLDGHVLRVAFFFRSERSAPAALRPTSNIRFMLRHHASNLSAPAYAAILAALLSASACGSKGQSQAPQQAGPPPAGVSILTLAPKDIPETSEFIASVRSLRSTTVKPEGEGIVTKILVKAGDHVRAGTPLVQIDPARQQAAVRSAEADLGGTEADVQYLAWTGQTARSARRRGSDQPSGIRAGTELAATG